MRAAVLGCALLVWLASGHAHAFQRTGRFAEPPETGGGGGRLFTGGPADRYTCKVCHTEGTPPHLTISGLPVDGYMPGQTYSIVIAWADNLKSVALNFEMSDRGGRGSGQLMAPALPQPGDLCPGTTTTGLVVGSAARQVGLGADCGAQRVTVLWTAPLPATDPLSVAIGPDAVLSGSLVSSDKDGTVNGDSVTDFSRIISPSGQSRPVVTRISAGCNAARGLRGSELLPGIVLLLLTACLFRRRRQRSGAP